MIRTNMRDDTYVLRGPYVLDEQGSFSGPVDIVVERGWIVDVGTDVTAPPAPSIDFAGVWVMPGVFDCHAHVALSSFDPMELLRTPVTQWSLETARNLRRTLECGVTFVRDASGADAGMRTAVERGYVPGPELSVSVVALSETGGHMDGFLPGPGLELSSEYTSPITPAGPRTASTVRTRCAAPSASSCARAPTGSSSARPAACCRSTTTRSSRSSPSRRSRWPCRRRRAAARA